MAKDEERKYEENVGRPHRNLPSDHPYLWQWEYRGTKDEREGLLERLDENVSEPQLEQEQLFDGTHT